MNQRLCFDVLAVGAPIVDYILQITYAYLESIPGDKGGAEVVDHLTLANLIERSGSIPVPVSGGSAGNMIKGLAKFGAECAMVGVIGNDALGIRYAKAMAAHRVRTFFKQSSTPTGQCLSLVTPDGKRTMRSFLGASKELSPDDLDPLYFEEVKLVHIEGHMIHTLAAMQRAMELAKKAGAIVSLDLASFEITRTFKKTLIDLIIDYADIVIGNHDEVYALTGLSSFEACRYLAGLSGLAVVLMGKRGVIVGDGSGCVQYPAYAVEPIDTTGAGDLFTSGFLYGWLQQCSIEKCVHYGALAGRAVVQVIGTEIPEIEWQKIKAEM